MVARTLGSLDKVGSTKMTRDRTRTAGIDTSKHHIDVAIAGEPDTFAVPNTAQG